VAEFVHEPVVFCCACTVSSLKKFIFAFSSADELLVMCSGKDDAFTRVR